MSEIGDLNLEKTPEDPPAHGRGVDPWTIAALLMIAAVAGGNYLLRRQADRPEAAPAASRAAVSPTPGRSGDEALDRGALPPLDESDQTVRQLARDLSSHPLLPTWLATDGLIRRFTAVVENIAQGVSPARQLRVLGPREPFKVLQRGQRAYIDPAGYERYNAVADAFASLDVQGCARVYRALRPLMIEAFRDLGHPDVTFDATIQQAFGVLIDTPVLDGDVAIEQQAVTYGFADPALESRSAAQKHLLRMGPRNTRLIQAKLRDLARALGFPEPRPSGSVVSGAPSSSSLLTAVPPLRQMSGRIIWMIGVV